MPTHKILLVEHDSLLRRGLLRALELGGYAVIEAATGAEALALAGHHQPSLILLDLGLPDGDGLEFAQELRRRAKTTRIPIAVLTGELVVGQRAEILARTCSGTIPKPFSPERLQRDLRLLLMLSRRGTERRFPRYPVETSAWYRLRGGTDPASADFVAGMVRTLSEGGLRIDLPNPIAAKSILDLRLPIPAGEVTAAGKVVYSLFWRDEQIEDGSFQHGIQFLNMDPDTCATLKRLVKGASLTAQ